MNGRALEPLVGMAFATVLLGVKKGRVTTTAIKKAGVEALKMKSCEACGIKIELGQIEEHQVIPLEVTQKAGLPESKAVTLCHDCHQELHRCCSSTVTNFVYNTETKRFEEKPWLGISKEYETTFDNLVQYKREKTKAY